MATNGQATSDQDQEVFKGIERAITGGRPPAMPIARAVPRARSACA